jgi:hypothetical protein
MGKLCFETGETKTLVKPGNDILMAFARNSRRDREAVSRHGRLFEKVKWAS